MEKFKSLSPLLGKILSVGAVVSACLIVIFSLWLMLCVIVAAIIPEAGAMAMLGVVGGKSFLPVAGLVVLTAIAHLVGKKLL